MHINIYIQGWNREILLGDSILDIKTPLQITVGVPAWCI